MTKVSIVLYYWILVAAVLLFAKTAGLADNNTAVIKILIVATILYVGVAMISRSRGRALEEKRGSEGQQSSSASSSVKRKKKHK
jgi:heme O synthase-like polyprenyltransferase